MQNASALSTAGAGAAGESSCLALLTFTTILAGISEKLERERHHLAAAKAPGNNRFDYVIVGGGSAGCALAARLSEQPELQVLLLERGGTEPEAARVPGFMSINLESDMIQNIQAVPDPNSCNGEGCKLRVARVLGGSSSVDDMLYIRGNKQDYNDWANYTGDDSWRYERVLKYFKRIEDVLEPDLASNTLYHAKGGPVPLSRAPHKAAATIELLEGFKDAGLTFRDVNAESQLGYWFTPGPSRSGERWSSYRSYLLRRALERPNLEVRTFAEAQRDLFDPYRPAKSPPRAVGVEYRDAAGELRNVTAIREVVLTAGAINTPYLLLRSGIGPASHLQDVKIHLVVDLPVGRGLQDLPLGWGLELEQRAANCVEGAERLEELLEYNEGPQGAQGAQKGPLSSAGSLAVTAFHRHSDSKRPAGVPDLQLLALPVCQQGSGERCHNTDTWHFNRVALAPAVLQPTSRGWVRLNATHPHAAPVIATKYLEHDEDQRALVRAYQVALEVARVLERRGQFTISRRPQSGCEGLEFGTDKYFSCLSTTSTTASHYYCCTARMGRRGDPSAVVDPELLVQGVTGLRVADSSVMPSITSGSTLAPEIMIAEKAADLIRKRTQRLKKKYFGELEKIRGVYAVKYNPGKTSQWF